mmetsp:Transcript_109293/g.309182  ORF Transcript_109293/g.309182 Transcript_109293/m.309182 type:complete len:241 (-) Transcript_109293:1102-1824(-)
MALQLLPLFDSYRCSKRKVDGKPAEHPLRVRVRIDGHGQVVVQFAVEVPCEAMHKRIDLGREVNLSVPVVAPEIPVRVAETEAGLDLLRRVEGLVELDDIRGLKVREVAVVLHVVPQLRRRHRSEVRGVAVWDADAVGRQEALRAVDAFGRELVVTERAEQLADYHVRLLRRLPEAHVVPDNPHVGPALDDTPVLERDDRVRVLLDGPDANFGLRPLGRAPHHGNERTSACTNDDHHKFA